MHTIPCVIFAGGKSSRMGEDKALLPFDVFSTLTEYQYSKLSKIFQNVYISTKNKSKFHFSASFIEDMEEASHIYAPTAGFIAAFKTLSSDAIFVISVDAPFIREETIAELISKDRDIYDATIAKTQRGIEPMCGIYRRSLLNSFLKMQDTNSHKLGLLLKNTHTQYIEFKNEKTFLNLNNPQDYKEALLLLDS